MSTMIVPGFLHFLTQQIELFSNVEVLPASEFHCCTVNVTELIVVTPNTSGQWHWGDIFKQKVVGNKICVEQFQSRARDADFFFTGTGLSPSVITGCYFPQGPTVVMGACFPYAATAMTESCRVCAVRCFLCRA